MKRLLLPIVLSCAIMLACPLSGRTGTGSQVGSLLGDPQTGLDGLDNYHATLKISFKGTQNGQRIDSTDSYMQTEWPKQSAKFTAIDTMDDSGGHQVILAGTVGEAQYFQADTSSPCTVNWGTDSSGPSQFRPASLLPAVKTARLAGEEAVDGIATRHYNFEAASLDLPAGTTASGEAWIAKDGGYVMKYVLEISGADATFGPGIQGTRRLEYMLSEVGAHPQVVYPTGCEPVLTDIPAMDDASDLTRLPGVLDYSTNAAPDEIFAFYQDKLVAMGWEKGSVLGQDTDSPIATFTRPDLSAAAFIFINLQGDTRWVTVMITGQESAGTSPSGAEATPGVSATAMARNPTVRVSLCLNILFGMVPKQPGPSSYHMEAVDLSPVWSGGKIAQRRETMSADVDGKDVHYTHRETPPDGSAKASEAYLIGSQEYAVLNGQVQPPAADSMTWKLWALNLTTVLSVGSTGAAAAGTETLDGRPAGVYELSGTGTSLSEAAGIGLPVSSVAGKVWVDQQTGALLKAVLDYQAGVRDTAGNDKGPGTGHLEITVTQVGQVTVTLPK